ncbi:TetR/AcrR family transcriptional regulator [Thalassobacillus sp. CUG 92003]|uniref:TetR/AcrR family transcriptional regulator n=1 Tax=Thalassobacillus sp. CUG 92003 TaxID=2736641 RepID=UPI0015E77D0C|nr:TetR/AcrR family transcriptional regulator [Thalassobacillus sp. CUG 92003]
MNHKTKHIIEQSIKLFANKGFSSTSVQEIANECDISKGAFYLHFKSKDALLMAIFEYYFDILQARIDDIEMKDLDPRTKLYRQLYVTYEEITHHRAFIIMQIREQAIPFNTSIETFIKRKRYSSYLFYKQHLLSIYGDAIEDYVWELSILLQTMFQSYMELMIFEQIDLDLDNVCEALLRRTDYLVEGFLQYDDHVVIDETLMKSIIPSDLLHLQLEDITSSLQAISDQELEPGLEEIKETAEVLLDELHQQNPRKALIKGMVTNLEAYEQYKGIAGKLRTYYDF